ncbi:MAG: beta-ketoacyl-ACP synthase 3 [Akkermansia sp.]
MAAHSDTPFKRLPVKIIGTGSYVPERRLTNADLEKMVDTSHEWIIERTGIVERRIAAPDEYTSHMGTKAAQRALESCGLKPEDIDLIIVATITPDTFTPSTSCYIQDALGAKNAAAFDISAACSGFLFAMKTAVQFLGTGQMKTALIIAAEKLSTVVNWEDRTTCVLFGDGAGAAVLQASTERKGKAPSSLRTSARTAPCMTCSRFRAAAPAAPPPRKTPMNAWPPWPCAAMRLSAMPSRA